MNVEFVREDTMNILNKYEKLSQLGVISVGAIGGLFVAGLCYAGYNWYVKYEASNRSIERKITNTDLLSNNLLANLNSVETKPIRTDNTVNTNMAPKPTAKENQVSTKTKQSEIVCDEKTKKDQISRYEAFFLDAEQKMFNYKKDIDTLKSLKENPKIDKAFRDSIPSDIVKRESNINVILLNTEYRKKELEKIKNCKLALEKNLWVLTNGPYFSIPAYYFKETVTVSALSVCPVKPTSALLEEESRHYVATQKIQRQFGNLILAGSQEKISADISAENSLYQMNIDKINEEYERRIAGTNCSQ